MSSHVTYARIQSYLQAIADKANLSIDNSPHGRFWNVDYGAFVNGVVPGGDDVACNGKAPPIIDKANPTNSPFFLILTDSHGWCGMPQMPKTGPFITEPGYQVTLADGTTVTGKQIQDDLREWLGNGFPNT